MRRKSEAHPELGYPKITQLLKKDGWDIGKRLVQRLRQEMGLKCPTKKPRQRRRGPSTGLPTKATHQGHVWTCDFVADRTAKGGSIRMLTVLDEYTRECLCIHVDRHLNAAKVRAVMSELISAYGSPEHIRSDNGSEFIEKSLRGWYADEGIKTLYIEPGSPWLPSEATLASVAQQNSKRPECVLLDLPLWGRVFSLVTIGVSLW